jgi:hypothetical protein
LEKFGKFHQLLKPHKIGKFWKISPTLETTQNWKILENVGAWLLFWVESFHLAKKNGNSNPTKDIFGKNPTKLPKFWRKKN